MFRISVVSRFLLASLSATLLLGCSGGTQSKAEPGKPAVKIAFIVKQPEETWFQLEWKFAEEAATEFGFQLIKIGEKDGDQVLPKIETAASQGAQGLIICTPDVKLGSAIVGKCKDRNLKLLTVDDQLVGPDGKFLDVPHLGISARKIGRSVGEALIAEFAKRGWKPEETGMMVVAHDELDTARERTEGEMEAATEKAFPKEKIFKATEKTTDIPGSREAAIPVLTQHQDIKYWLICSMNDSGTLGAVRATEMFNIPASNVIAIGINGDKGAIEDLKKSPPTGFFGSILLQAKRHGHDTAKMMFEWIKDGKEPPKITYTDGILITRDNFKETLKGQGLESLLK